MRCEAATPSTHGPTIPAKRYRRPGQNAGRWDDNLEKQVNDQLSSPQHMQQNSNLCYIGSQPTGSIPMSDNARFGFVNFAETWNGRLAMLGIAIGLGTELLTGQGILSQIGLG